jgi:outer membrane receptor protein involved in Fe transport
MARSTPCSLWLPIRRATAGDLYNQAVDGPFVAPSFTRHYRYNEVAFYGEDSWRITQRFTATIGLRWEYFGVLHSPDAEKFLDANFYLDSVGVPTALDPGKTFAEQIRDGRFERTNNFFNQDWNNFGPRVGFA